MIPTVCSELKEVNRVIQQLREELVTGDAKAVNTESVMPMIRVELKETKEAFLAETLNRIIESHYYESSNLFEETIAEVMDLRQVFVQL